MKEKHLKTIIVMLSIIAIMASYVLVDQKEYIKSMPKQLGPYGLPNGTTEVILIRQSYESINEFQERSSWVIQMLEKEEKLLSDEMEGMTAMRIVYK